MSQGCGILWLLSFSELTAIKHYLLAYLSIYLAGYLSVFSISHCLPSQDLHPILLHSMYQHSGSLGGKFNFFIGPGDPDIQEEGSPHEFLIKG